MCTEIFAFLVCHLFYYDFVTVHGFQRPIVQWLKLYLRYINQVRRAPYWFDWKWAQGVVSISYNACFVSRAVRFNRADERVSSPAPATCRYEPIHHCAVRHSSTEHMLQSNGWGREGCMPALWLQGHLAQLSVKWYKCMKLLRYTCTCTEHNQL